MPIRVDLAQLGGTERAPLDRRARRSVGRDGLVRAKRLVGSDGSSHNPDAPDLSGRRLVLSYAGLGFSSMTGPERSSVRANSAVTERGATRYCAPGTSGAIAGSAMSSGESSDVSIHRCQPTAAAGADGRSKSSASQ